MIWVIIWKVIRIQKETDIYSNNIFPDFEQITAIQQMTFIDHKMTTWYTYDTEKEIFL